MSTSEATKILAGKARSGGLDDVAWEVKQAIECGNAWKWEAAKGHLDEAYRLLGAEPDPASGYDWHCGRHPIQQAMGELV